MELTQSEQSNIQLSSYKPQLIMTFTEYCVSRISHGTNLCEFFTQQFKAFCYQTIMEDWEWGTLDTTQ